MILPSANETDLDDLPDALRDAMEIHLVSSVEEALEIALV